MPLIGKTQSNYLSLFHGPHNTPRSIYQYSNMIPRLSRQTPISGYVFFVSKSLGIERQMNLKICNLKASESC